MPRVKRSVHARKKRRKVLEQAKGYWGLKQLELPPRQGAGRALARLRLPRPQEQEAHVPAALDHAHQRGRARARGSRTTSSSSGLRKAEIELDRKVLADLAVSDPAAFTKIAEQAKAALEKPESGKRKLRSSAGRRSTSRRSAHRSTHGSRGAARRSRWSTSSSASCAGTCRCGSSAASTTWSSPGRALRALR